MALSGNQRVNVTIYRYTGKHGPFHIPHQKCVECDLSIALVNRTVEEIHPDCFDVEVKSWFSNFWEPLIKGGWHAPIITIDGEVFNQGVVPDRQKLRSALIEALECREAVRVADPTTA